MCKEELFGFIKREKGRLLIPKYAILKRDQENLSELNG